MIILISTIDGKNAQAFGDFNAAHAAFLDAPEGARIEVVTEAHLARFYPGVVVA